MEEELKDIKEQMRQMNDKMSFVLSATLGFSPTDMSEEELKEKNEELEAELTELEKADAEYNDYDLVVALEKLASTITMENEGWDSEDEEAEAIYEENLLTGHDKKVILDAKENLASTLSEFQLEAPKHIFDKMVDAVEKITQGSK